MPHGFTFRTCWFLDGVGESAGGAVALPESGGSKIVLASLLREKSSGSKEWNASCLTTGYPGSVSRMISSGRTDQNVARKRNEPPEILSAKENTPPMKSFNVNPRGLTSFKAPFN